MYYIPFYIKLLLLLYMMENMHVGYITLICKGPKYRFPVQIDFNSCREEIAGALQDFVIAGVNESMLSLMP